MTVGARVVSEYVFPESSSSKKSLRRNFKKGYELKIVFVLLIFINVISILRGHINL